VVVAGGDGWDLGREEEGRWASAHAAAAGVGDDADVGITFDLVPAAGDERRDASGAGQSETLRNPAQRDEPFFERKVCDETALERAVLLGDRFEGRVEGLHYGFDDVFELRAAGMDLGALQILALLAPVEKLLDAIDPGGRAEVHLRDGAIEEILFVVDLLENELAPRLLLALAIRTELTQKRIDRQPLGALGQSCTSAVAAPSAAVKIGTGLRMSFLKTFQSSKPSVELAEARERSRRDQRIDSELAFQSIKSLARYRLQPFANAPYRRERVAARW
jgi:hypothetical protein